MGQAPLAACYPLRRSLSVYVPPFRFALRVASTPQAPLAACYPLRRSLSPFTSPPFGLLSVSRRRRRLRSRRAIRCDAPSLPFTSPPFGSLSVSRRRFLV